MMLRVERMPDSLVGLESTIKLNRLAHEGSSPFLSSVALAVTRGVLLPKGLLNPGKAVPTLARCAEFGRMHVHGGKLVYPDLERF